MPQSHNQLLIESRFWRFQIDGFSIPVGYWSVPSSISASPYIPGAWPYIQRAVTWARTDGLHTIIDLHGAPGSQNGYDNSGQRTNSPQWALDPANVATGTDGGYN